MPSPDRADPDSLEDGGGSADEQRRKDGPRQITLRLLGNPGHNDHGQNHRRQNDHSGLKASADGH